MFIQIGLVKECCKFKFKTFKSDIKNRAECKLTLSQCKELYMCDIHTGIFREKLK